MNDEVDFCAVRTGRVSKPLASLVAEWGTKSGVRYALLEPASGPLRLSVPLGLIHPSELNADIRDQQLMEARLFYDHGTLHMLADGDQTRIAAWWVGEKDTPPAPLNEVFGVADASFAEPKQISMAGDEHSAKLQEVARPILLNTAANGDRDAQQRGQAMVSQHVGSKVIAREYYHDGKLLWWRLTDGEER